MFRIVNIICTDNDKVIVGDVLSKSATHITVAIGERNAAMKMTLTKSQKDRIYVGNLHGMEFTTTGEELD